MSRSDAAQARRAARMAPDSPVTTATVEAALTGDTVAQAKIQAVVDSAVASKTAQTTDAEEAASFISVLLWEKDIPTYDDKRNANFEAFVMQRAESRRFRFMSGEHVMSIQHDAVLAYAALLARCDDDVEQARKLVADVRLLGTVEKFDAITSALARDYPEEENIMQGGFDPATVFDTQPAKERVEELLGNIDTLDAEIIGLSFGLDGEPMTDEQIAEWVGLSRSRVTQRRLRGMQTMSDGEQS